MGFEKVNFYIEIIFIYYSLNSAEDSLCKWIWATGFKEVGFIQKVKPV